MLTLVPTTFVLQEVTQSDLLIASIAWGFTLGFGFLTTWAALKQTLQVHGRYGVKRLNSPYVWMIWLEIVVCLSFSIICWLYILGKIGPSFAFYFCILTLWALQVQFLLQIIINRVSILLVNRKTSLYLKIAVATIITSINVSVYCIWIPARLQISDSYVHINTIWDRCEKVLYLVIDAALNFYFIRIVSKRLVGQGLTKYQSLVTFNIWIIGFSLGMDVLIIGMMSLKNTFVYMQFHPLAYIVKLKIEMSMADLIARIAQEPNNAGTHSGSGTRSGTHNTNSRNIGTVNGTVNGTRSEPTIPHNQHSNKKAVVALDWYDNSKDLQDIHDDETAMELRDRSIQVKTKKEILVTVERAESGRDGAESFGSSGVEQKLDEEDTMPLRDEDVVRKQRMAKGMGSQTTVWARQHE